jgi:hypothetical protein
MFRAILSKSTKVTESADNLRFSWVGRDLHGEQETELGQTGIEAGEAKPNPTATGRLQSLRLSSTLLAITPTTTAHGIPLLDRET